MKSNREATSSVEEAARKATEREMNVVRRVARPEFRLSYLQRGSPRDLIAKASQCLRTEVRGRTRFEATNVLRYVFARIDYEHEWSKVR